MRGPHDRAKENSEEFFQLRLNRELTEDESFLLSTKIDGDRPPGNSAEGGKGGDEDRLRRRLTKSRVVSAKSRGIPRNHPRRRRKRHAG